MSKSTSLYLDILRSIAAFAVFMMHASFRGITGGLFWRLGIFGDDAVMAFFALSGFVIMFCVEHKHDSLLDYSIARLSRLWSVVVPALLLTALLDVVRMRLFHIYDTNPDHIQNYTAFAYLSSLLFLNSVWTIHLTPGSDTPFWSLSFEFFYYVFWGIVFYNRGLFRWAGGACILLIAGPQIVLLLPIWLSGALAYRLGRRHQSVHFGYFLWTGSFAGLIWYYVVGKQMFEPTLIHLYTGAPFELLIDYRQYVFCGFILLNILGWNIAGDAAIAHMIIKLEKPIRAVANRSFSMYLFHMPLLLFFRALTLQGIGQWWSILSIVTGTLVAIWLLAPLTEWRKDIPARLLLRLVDSLLVVPRNRRELQRVFTRSGER
jgi:peptidoglycan/LPS O-acetylase OafA/YrhL